MSPDTGYFDVSGLSRGKEWAAVLLVVWSVWSGWMLGIMTAIVFYGAEVPGL